MLALDDPRWSRLEGAYGSASEIPDLLRQLASSPAQAEPTEEPFFSLWSALCHQGDIYTGSYAATPHLVDIACATPGPVDFSFFLLPAAIEVARHTGRGPPVPDDLVSDYEAAIARLVDCVNIHSHEDWSEDMVIAAAAALAVAKGRHSLAEALMNLDGDWIARINAGEWGE